MDKKIITRKELDYIGKNLGGSLRFNVVDVSAKEFRIRVKFIIEKDEFNIWFNVRSKKVSTNQPFWVENLNRESPVRATNSMRTVIRQRTIKMINMMEIENLEQ